VGRAAPNRLGVGYWRTEDGPRALFYMQIISGGSCSKTAQSGGVPTLPQMMQKCIYNLHREPINSNK
jgi:hypothetical protein